MTTLRGLASSEVLVRVGSSEERGMERSASASDAVMSGCLRQNEGLRLWLEMRFPWSTVGFGMGSSLVVYVCGVRAGD